MTETGMYIACFACLLVTAAYLGYVHLSARRDRQERELDDMAEEFFKQAEAEQKREEERRAEFVGWVASMSKALALMQKDIKRIADGLEPGASGPAAARGDAAADDRQRLYEEGIQNILNYGTAEMRRRGELD